MMNYNAPMHNIVPPSVVTLVFVLGSMEAAVCIMVIAETRGFSNILLVLIKFGVAIMIIQV